MMNYIIQQGHLCNAPIYYPAEGEKKSACLAKIGVYQGKDRQGNDLPSLFFGIMCYGKDAETLKDGKTGDLVVASGRFTETTSVGNDGKEYVNKTITGNAKLCYKGVTQAQAATQYAAPQAQPMPQQVYAQPAPQVNYAQPMPQYQAPVDPWAGTH